MNTNNCPHCGRSMLPNKQKLTLILVECLGEFYGAVSNKGATTINIYKEFSWNQSKFNNFQKLKYFGLIAPGEDRGKWTITRLGADFIRGRVKIQDSRLTFNNHVIEKYGIEKDVSEIFRTNPYLDRYDYKDPEQLVMI